MYDPTEEMIYGLNPTTANQARWLVWACRTAGAPVIITSGRRSQAEQHRLFDAGRTKTLQSKHLRGEAFDIDVAGLSRDAVPTWFWNTVGPWAESQLGLVWGGRWKSIYDPGHFETNS